MLWLLSSILAIAASYGVMLLIRLNWVHSVVLFLSRFGSFGGILCLCFFLIIWFWPLWVGERTMILALGLFKRMYKIGYAGLFWTLGFCVYYFYELIPSPELPGYWKVAIWIWLVILAVQRLMGILKHFSMHEGLKENSDLLAK